MKAFYVTDIREEWGVPIHGETRSKALSRAKRCWPDLDFEWTYMRAYRMADLDNKPFTLENLQGHMIDPEAEDGVLSEFHNDCDCLICESEEKTPDHSREKWNAKKA